MPNWLIKTSLQRVISWLPASHFWNRLLQQYVTGSLELTWGQFEARLDFCRRHLESLCEFRPSGATGFRALELGTGWFPTVPVGLYLCGAAEVWTFDIAPFVRSSNLRQMLARFEELDRAGKLRDSLPRLQPERMEKLRNVVAGANRLSPAALLEELSIRLRVCDARQTGLAPASVDFFVSTSVLEYIPREVIRSILLEFKQIGTIESVHSHYINLRDEFSYFDDSITPFNYLKYAEARWKYLNSPLTWQSRLRIPDYRALFTDSGFEIVREKDTAGEPRQLKTIRLAPEFQRYSFDDLLVLFSWLVVRPVRT